MSPNDAAPAANPVAYAEYETRLTEHLRKYYGESLGLDERRVRLSIARRLARERGRELARILDDLVGLGGTRMLDVGSGWGELLLECVERGAVGSGIELDAEEVAISELLLESYYKFQMTEKLTMTVHLTHVTEEPVGAEETSYFVPGLRVQASF